MKQRVLFLSMILVLSSTIISSAQSVYAAGADRTSSCVEPGGTNTLQGTLQGANYTIDVPSNWNGTLLLFSHGYVFATEPIAKPALDASDPLTRATLLQEGYALAGSSYSQNGWAVQQGFHDQITLLDFFNRTCGQPGRTILWGESLGGMITAGLVQLYSGRFAGALPMCGVLSGGIGAWNQALDSAFAFNLLLAEGSLQIDYITDPTGVYKQAETLLNMAQKTPQGRARIALVAALGDVPGWYDPASAEPAPSDYVTQEMNQYLWESNVDFAFSFIGRADVELRAGGNPSWNNGVNYRHQLAFSVDRQEVVALYKQAGLNLDQDIAALNAAPRIKADPKAVAYLNKYITYNGKISIPVLTVHTTGDGLVVNQNEQAYASVVRSRENSPLLRKTFVHRAGHCTFTPAEIVTALQTLVHRIDSGTWDSSTDPARLNEGAQALGPSLNTVPPAFIAYQPAVFLRPFDARWLPS